MADNKLTKADIIDSIYEKTNISRKDIHAVFDSIIREIKKGLAEDKVIELRGFGTFEIRLRKGRANARNPKTGKVFPVDDHGVPVFRSGQELRKIAWSMRK